MADRYYNLTRGEEVEPFKLRGLMQAVYVSECLCIGFTQEEISEKFNGDTQLVDMWVSFVRHNHWVAYDKLTHRWSMTAKGERQAHDVQISSSPYH
jgi:hypothetical protein